MKKTNNTSAVANFFTNNGTLRVAYQRALIRLVADTVACDDCIKDPNNATTDYHVCLFDTYCPAQTSLCIFDICALMGVKMTLRETYKGQKYFTISPTDELMEYVTMFREIGFGYDCLIVKTFTAKHNE